MQTEDTTLARALSMLRSTLESTIDGIVITDSDGRLAAYNQRFIDMWPVSREVVDSGEYRQVIEALRPHLKVPDLFVATIEAIETSALPDTVETLELVDGRTFQLLAKSQQVANQTVGRVWSFLDVTEQRRTQEAFDSCRIDILAIIDQSPVGIYLLDEHLRLQHVNPKARPFFSDIHYLIGRDFAEVADLLWPQRPAAEIMDHLRRTLATGEPFYATGFAPRREHRGVEQGFNWELHRMRWPNGRQGVACYLIDLSIHRSALEALQKSESRKSAILDSALDAIVTIDHRGSILDFNPAAQKMFGYTHDQAIGQAMDALLIPERLRKRHHEGLAHYLAKGVGRVLSQRMEMPALHADGHEFPVDLSVTRISGIEPPMFTATLRDITEAKETQEMVARALRELKEVKAALDEHAIVAITDRHGKITYVNDKFCAISKYSRTELIGQDHRIINSGHHPKEFIRNLWQTIRAGHVWKGEIKNRAKDASFYWVDTTIVPYLGEDGKPVQYIAIRADITERKYAEEQMARALRELKDVKAALDEHAIVAITDRHGKISYVNDKFCAISKYSREELIGQDHRIINSGYHPKEFIRNLWQTIRSGRVWTGEILNRAKDGSFYWVDTTIVPYLGEDGKPIQYIAIRTDITERKHTEDTVRESEERLRTALTTAEQAGKMKDQFLAMLSHELRTPLTPVLMTATALEADPRLDPEVARDIAMIRRNVELEAKLIDDLLDLSRITNGKLSLRMELVDVNEAVRHTSLICRPQVLEKGINLTLDLDDHAGYVRADPARLQQVLWNLLTNAVKFTPEHGGIGITTRRAASDNVDIRVHDTGLGIAPDVLPRIFSAFEQGDAAVTRQFGGLGLGLAIAKAVVQMHNGSIIAESAGIGKGAAFSVTLPSESQQPLLQPPIPRPERPVEVTQLRLLVVEDHPDTARTLGILLRRSGFIVITAPNVATALKLATEQPFDMIISDIGLPDASGYKLMREMRERYSIPGIAMSGYGTEEDVRKAQEAGFSTHLVKPVSVAKLEQAIHDVVARP